jgi:peptide/nickel transport system permease protein
VSAELTIGGLVIAWFTAIPLGIIAAMNRARPLDYLSRTIAVAGLSIPSFVVGTLIVLFLALWFGWLPPTGYVPFYENPWTNVQQFFFPAIVVGYRSSALLSRMVRSSLLDVLGQDYIRTAVAKGLGGWTMIRRHAMKNSLIPAVTLMGAQVGSLLAGAVITETIFSLPGVGRLFINAVGSRDYTLIQAIMLFVALVVAVCNLLVDLSYGLLDPRIRYP